MAAHHLTFLKSGPASFICSLQVSAVSKKTVILNHNGLISFSANYVIIDSAPVTRFQDSQSICSKVDGVIVVLSQGKTRRQVAIRIKKELEDAGARILGVVLNRRKYHIPDWIYRRL
jgi:MinD-like ATPase involved in chromosome partitioning or flagellar assembly